MLDQISFGANRFDLLVALDGVEHNALDVKSLHALRSMMRSNGTAIFTVPACMFLCSDHDVANENKRHYTLTEFKKKDIEAGFKN